MKIECAERPWIVENDARTVGQHESRTCEARQRVRRAVAQPITRHAKVGVQDTTIVKVNKLVLATTFHRSDSYAAKRTKLRRREPASQ